MAAHFQSLLRAPRQRAAVLVYALVLTVSVAAILYVASSVYQARQKSAAIQDYASQKALVNWQLAYAMRSAYQNSLDLGYGLSDDNAWETYSTAGSSYAAGGWPTTTSIIDRSAALNSLQGVMNDSDPLNPYHWALNNFTLYPYKSTLNFSLSDVFTVPGWQARRQGETGVPIGGGDLVTLFDPRGAGNPNIDFQLISGLPAEVSNRSDLPFGPNLSNWPSPYGAARWFYDGIGYTLSTRTTDPYLATGGSAVTYTPSAYPGSWAVEEPITNYQLLLLNPERVLGGQIKKSWDISGRGTITISNSSPGVASTDYRGKILVHGPIDANDHLRGTKTTIHGVSYGPIAAELNTLPLPQDNADLIDSSVLNEFDWRITRPNTKLSFGRPSSMDLPTFFSTSAWGSRTISGSVSPSDIERKTRILNSQSNSQTPMDAVTAKSNFCYLNSVLSFSSEGLLQWSKQSTSGNNSMGAVSLVFTFSSSFTDPVKNDWGTLAASSLASGISPTYAMGYTTLTGVPVPPYKPTSPITLGVAGVQYFNQTALSSITVVEVDLRQFGKDTSLDGITPDSNSSVWGIPHEIYIYRKATTQNLVVRIIGDATATTNPVRIVVKDAIDIRLVPDPTAGAVVANTRPFVLVTQSSASNGVGVQNLSFETPVATNAASQLERWVGVVIAANGLSLGKFDSYSPNYTSASWGSSSRGTPNSSPVTWYGTILACKSFVIAGDHTYTPLDLTIAPDPTNSVLTSFLPKYDAAIPLHHPVPLWVPRMLWTFE